MAVTVGTGDLFSGGSASGTTSQSSSLSQGSVGATLDLSNLQSIQGHTINDGLTANEALSFASLIAQTAQSSNAQGTRTVQNAVSEVKNTISEVKNTISSFFKSPILLGGVGILVFLFAYKTFKGGR